MSRPHDRKLVSIPSGDDILRLRWLSLPAQPLYTSAVEKLRLVETQISEAQRAGQQADVDQLQADRLEAETQLLCLTERLHVDLHDLLDPTVTAFVRYTLNALEAFIRWQSILAASRHMIQSTGFNPSALPQRLAIESILACELRSAFAMLLAEAQASGAITSAEANHLLSGKQLTVTLTPVTTE
ncbi:MAG: hypothetical protein CV090_14820 [Nitrospira sp. WS238]|nr:hypothetical protein [Nitrospira sp. WS238]